MPSILVKIWRFYADGFRNMTVGRTLWLIIIVKLIVIFVVLKLLFFPDMLTGSTDAERGAQVLDMLTERNDNSL